MINTTYKMNNFVVLRVYKVIFSKYVAYKNRHNEKLEHIKDEDSYHYKIKEERNRRSYSTLLLLF